MGNPRVVGTPVGGVIRGKAFSLCPMCSGIHPKHGKNCPKRSDSAECAGALKITSIDDLKRAITAVVRYNWDDERADYQADELGSREVHIFRHLVALDNWIEGTEFTPESYLEVGNG